MGMEHAEILRDQVFVVAKLLGAAGEYAASGVEDDGLIGNVERQLAVLFN
jgi:hypothetical protein